MRWTLPGRLTRRSFWIGSALIWLVFFAVRAGLGLEEVAAQASLWAAGTLMALALLGIARLHDGNRSGWWLACILIPIAGALWLAWQLAARPGTPSSNRFGPDPRSR